MLNIRSIDVVNAARADGLGVKPLYDSYSFLNIPTLISALLTGEGHTLMPEDVLGDLPRRYRAVLALWIDAMGWHVVEPLLDRHPFLRRAVAQGVVSKITSLFPSTTSAHIAGFFTGLPPAQSGVYEWFQYEPKLGRIIAPLLFSYAGEKERDTLTKENFHPLDLFPAQSVWLPLVMSGAKIYVLQPSNFARSAPSKALGQLATAHGYSTFAEGLVRAYRLIESHSPSDAPPALIWMYYGDYDGVCHDYGPNALEATAELEHTLDALENVLIRLAQGSEALLLVFADHGQIRVDAKTTIYLNQVVPDFARYVAQGRKGHLLVPAGSPRDFFLHVKPELLDEAQAVFAEATKGRARVLKTESLIEQGFFGANPTETFLARVGNLVVLPEPGETVYYYEKDRFEQKYYGHHGGLTPEEIEVPLIAMQL
ncbi:MAG: alkaline phosphatase family protein [Anaerolineae bacterium]|nr:alkaline phosphatase family protein [Anaerolineae bacterium]